MDAVSLGQTLNIIQAKGFLQDLELLDGRALSGVIPIQIDWYKRIHVLGKIPPPPLVKGDSESLKVPF